MIILCLHLFKYVVFGGSRDGSGMKSAYVVWLTTTRDSSFRKIQHQTHTDPLTHAHTDI